MPAVTLFVKRLPATATNEHLGEVFSEIGPLKNCFVVRDKGKMMLLCVNGVFSSKQLCSALHLQIHILYMNDTKPRQSAILFVVYTMYLIYINGFFRPH